MIRQAKRFLFKNVLETNYGLLRFARSVQFRVWKAKMAWRNRSSSSVESRQDVIYVDPDSIKGYIGDLPWSRFDMRGLVKGGDWDLKSTSFTGWDLYHAIRAHFLEGKAWEDTEFVQRVLAEIESGKTKWGCSTTEEYRERLATIDALYESIKKDGFMSKADLAQKGTDGLSWESDSPFDPYDDVVVCIDRDGGLHLRDGKHRLAIAKVLGLDEIPVVVGLRHAEWDSFTKEVDAWVQGRGGTSYQPFTHPDLNYKSLHDERRAGLLLQHMPPESERVLDIGAFFGYFCHVLEANGKTCTAVEYHPENVYFMTKLRDAEGRQFEIVNGSIFDFDRAGAYDTILALNIFHHFIKTPELLQQLEELLGQVTAHTMFFEPHLQSDYVMQNSFWNPTPDEFVSFVMDKAGFTQQTLIDTVDRGRKLYLLRR